MLVAQLRLTLCDPMDSIPTDSSVLGILQGRILAWVAIPFFRGSSQPRDQTQVSYIADRFFTIWPTRKAQLVPKLKTTDLHNNSGRNKQWVTEQINSALSNSEKHKTGTESHTAGLPRWLRQQRIRLQWGRPRLEKIPWRREWLPTLVLLPGESHGQRSLRAAAHGVLQ